MLIEINGDILDCENGVILHQVNCMGKMNAGLAKQIQEKFPSAYVDYVNAFLAQKLLLGNVIFSYIPSQDIVIAHCCGQYDYGRTKQYTDYNALNQAFFTVKNLFGDKRRIFIPHGIGCGLGGGNWKEVKERIYHCFGNSCTIVKKDPI